MSHRLRLFPLVLVAASLAAAESGAAASGEITSGDTGPRGRGSKHVPAGDYELLGFFGAGDDLEVSVMNTATGKSQWLHVGQKAGGLLVEKADSAAGTATLAVGGRRYRLRLASEAPPEPAVPVAEAKPLSPEEARAQRKARIEAMRQNMTPEQMQAFGKIMEVKMPELMKAHPELFGRPPDSAEAQQKMSALIVPVFHEGAEASAQLPGKDGKITPVPADFDAMMTAEMNDHYEQAQKSRAGVTPPNPPAATNRAP